MFYFYFTLIGLDERVIKSEVVRRTMSAVDRGLFAPAHPYMDCPQPIGYGATISAPHMHAHATELLKDKLKPGAKALGKKNFSV